MQTVQDFIKAVPVYVAGTDATTVKLVRDYIARIDAAMDDGDFQAAEKLIADVANVRNIPFKIEFAAQCAMFN